MLSLQLPLYTRWLHLLLSAGNWNPTMHHSKAFWDVPGLQNSWCGLVNTINTDIQDMKSRSVFPEIRIIAYFDKIQLNLLSPRRNSFVKTKNTAKHRTSHDYIRHIIKTLNKTTTTTKTHSKSSSILKYAIIVS